MSRKRAALLATDLLMLMPLGSAMSPFIQGLIYSQFLLCKDGTSQFSSSNSLKVICFQGHVEHVLVVDNLLLGLLPMVMIAILLAAKIPVAFLDKLINVCAGRQLVSRKEEGEMMVQG